MSNPRTLRTFALLLIAGSALLRAWFLTTLPFGGDEAYHWEWSRHLAPAYHDHPGMTAWLIRASTEAFGTSLLTARLPALLCMVGMWLCVYGFARELTRQRGGDAAAVERAGLFAVVFAQFAPIYAVFSMYVSTDPAVLLFWTTSLWLGYRALRSGSWLAWIGFGISLGCAANSKFLAGLLVPAALFYLLLARRKAGRLPPLRVALAVLIAGGMVAPLVLWNRDNDWSTFYFNFVSRQDVESHWHDVPVYVVGQALALSPLLFWILVVGLRQSWRAWRREQDSGALFLFSFTAVPLAYFLYVSFNRAVSPHWPVVAWIAMLVWTSAAIGQRAEWLRSGALRWSVRGSVGLTVLVGILAHVPQRYLDYDLAWAGRPRKVRVKALAERYGWEQLGLAVAAARDELDAGNGERDVFVAASRYGLAATTSFYMPDRPTMLLWCSPRHHGDHYRFWDALPNHAGEDAVIVIKRRVYEELPILRQHFESIELLERIDIVDPWQLEEVEEPSANETVEIEADDFGPAASWPVTVRSYTGLLDVSNSEPAGTASSSALRPFVIRSFWIVRCKNFDGREPWERKWPAPDTAASETAGSDTPAATDTTTTGSDAPTSGR